MAPTHFDRKFFSLMVGRPHSFANASATNVLPVPIGPVKSSPIGTRAGPALADALGDDQEVLLHLVHAADDVEAVRRLDELDEAVALAFEDLPLPLADTRRSTSRRAVSAGSFGEDAGGAASGATSFAISSWLSPAVSAASLAARSATPHLPRAVPR